MKLGIVGHGFVGTAVDHGFTQDVANQIHALADEAFPYCWKYLIKL